MIPKLFYIPRKPHPNGFLGYGLVFKLEAVKGLYFFFKF
jgi:hypothetical protein